MRRSRFLLHLIPLLSVPLLSSPAHAIADRSLYLTIDKPQYSLGETVKITVQIATENCRYHDHLLDIYIYDSENFLTATIARGTPGGFGLQPRDFPVEVSYTPPKIDVYTVKLYVIHFYLIFIPIEEYQAHLEDTATFKVVPYQATTTQTFTVAKTTTTTVKSTSTTTVTTTNTQMVRIDWTNPLLMAAIPALVGLLVAMSFIVLGRARKAAER
jgi:hypothetical protein